MIRSYESERRRIENAVFNGACGTAGSSQSVDELYCLLSQRSRGARLSKMRLPDRDTRVHCSGDVTKELAAAAAARDRSPGVGCASSAALSRVSPEESSARAAIFIQDSHCRTYKYMHYTVLKQRVSTETCKSTKKLTLRGPFDVLRSSDGGSMARHKPVLLRLIRLGV